MKRNLTLFLCGLALIAFATGCSRNNRNFQGGQFSGGSASSAVSAQATLAPADTATGAPAAATSTPAPAQATDTVAPGQSSPSSSSGAISSQLDNALNQLDQQLNSGDALDDTPAAP